MADDSNTPGPRLVRPIPRRPFRLDLGDPSENLHQQRQSQPSPLQQPQPTLPPAAAFARLLGPSFNNNNNNSINSSNHAANGGDNGLATPPIATPSLSRTQSVVNLGSTLLGIFSQVPSSATQPASRFPGEDVDTPWGTGAQTPVRRPGLDEGTLELMRKRANSASLPAMSALRAQGTSGLGRSGGGGGDGGGGGGGVAAGGVGDATAGADDGALLPGSSTLTAWAAYPLSLLPVRIALLTLLGMGYGVLVMRLHDEHNLTPFAGEAGGFAEQGGHYQPKYLGFWGATGVMLGLLLPWFDAVWDQTFNGAAVDGSKRKTRAKPTTSSTDWALVVRGIGAFVGIVFAIRRLPWTSTLQVSMTLALTNPFLWYLIDRSKPGFVLSAAVGLVGTAVLLGINPDAIPSMTPNIVPASSTSAYDAGASATDGNVGGYRDRDNNASFATPLDDERGALMLGGLARKETVEMGIWMASVLFCSCVCFGNIGRRLALNRTNAAAQRRWARA